MALSAVALLGLSGCGDEDTGQMSSWYVFSALGFYPVTHGGIIASHSPIALPATTTRQLERFIGGQFDTLGPRSPSALDG